MLRTQISSCFLLVVVLSPGRLHEGEPVHESIHIAVRRDHIIGSISFLSYGVLHIFPYVSFV